MRVGVSSASLFMRQNNAEALRTLNDLGVKTTEVFLTTFSEYGKAYAETLLPHVKNLSVNSVHDLTSQFEPQLFSRHAGVRADAYSILQKVMESAKTLGAPYYTFHGASRAKRADRSGERDNFPWLIECFETLLAFCRDFDVTLCLENVEWSTYNRPGVFSKISSALPQLRGVLDIKQARISQYPYEEYLREMGEKIAYVHISDIDGDGRMCLPGRGTFDFDTLIKQLQGVGFDGALLI